MQSINALSSSQALLTAIKKLASNANSQPSLIRTFGLVTAVKENGFYVDVTTLINKEQQEPIENVPVVHNRYLNYYIVEGDIVMLLTISHLQENVLETGELLEAYPIESYIAIPMVLKTDYDYNNEFRLRTPQKTVDITVNEQKLEALLKAADVIINTQQNINLTTKQDTSITAEQNINAAATQNVSIEAKQKVSIITTQPMDIGTQSAKLGSLLVELANILSSAQAGPIPTQIGPQFGPSLGTSASQVTAWASKVKQVFT